MKQSIFGVTLTLTIFIVVITSIAVSLGYYLADRDDPLQWEAVGATVASILFAISLFYLYSRSLLAPIRQIMSALSAFQGGRRVGGLPTDRVDELGHMARGIDDMIREVRDRSAQSEASRARLEALFAVVQEGIVITDQYGIIDGVNPSLCRMFGYEESELLGQSNVMLMPEPYAKHHDMYMRDSIRTGSLGFMGMYRDLTALRKDGTIFPVVISVETLEVDGVPLFAAVIRDITKEKEHEHELLNAKMRAEVANEAKSSFLSMMSHEIRTPLNGVMGVLQLLETEITDPWQQELLSVAGRSATNLLHIVNDILDLSKAESGNMELSAQEFNLRELLEESIELYSLELLATDVDIRFYMPIDMPYRLIGDAFRLQQMINNLLSNAVKFTHQGEISLSVDWEWRDINEIAIRIDLADTGEGIAADKLKAVFEPFFQSDNTINRAHGGTGLGLSIVKHITTLMGGRIWLDSKPGKGSTFHLHLHFPLAEGASKEVPGALAGRHILYAGEKRKQSMLQDYLAYHQASVDYTDIDTLERNGLPAEPVYDEIIVECHDQAAMERLKQLAAKHIQAGRQFICLHEHIMPPQADLGSNVFSLHKPVLFSSQDKVFRPLEQKADAVELPEQGEHTKMETPRILLVEDNPVNQMVAKAMLVRMGYEVVVANNGEEAVDSVESGNADLVLMDCHMPVMDGFEATRRIRDYLNGSRLPIIAMTADASVSDRERCLNAGMDDHLAKPIKFEILQSTLESWLKA